MEDTINEQYAAILRAKTKIVGLSRDELLKELELTAANLDESSKERFPAFENGQIDYIRVVMECAADNIRAFLATAPSE